MTAGIHSSAIVHEGAKIGHDVTIGPFCVVENNVEIGDGCVLEPYALIKSFTRMGAGNKVYSHVCLGGDPQHLQYKGEDTELVIGDNNFFRECATVNRGTVQGNKATVIGSNCMIMAYAHIAHDCQLGDNVIIANSVNLAGHVEVGNHAVINGMAGIVQFLRIGEYAFLGGASGYNLDIPPYMLAHGVRGRLFGPNVIGLKRHGFSKEVRQALKKAYKIIFRSGLTREEAMQQAETEFGEVREVRRLIEFIRDTKCGVAPDYHKNGNEG